MQSRCKEGSREVDAVVRADERARQELGLTANDVKAIQRRGGIAGWLLFLIAGVLTSTASFLLGYVVDMEWDIGYPYASIGMGMSVTRIKHRWFWISLVVLPLLAIVSFAVGAYVAEPPNYGLNPEYSVYSKRDSTDCGVGQHSVFKRRD